MDKSISPARFVQEKMVFTKWSFCHRLKKRLPLATFELHQVLRFLKDSRGSTRKTPPQTVTNQEPSRPWSHHHERHHQLLHLHPRTERTASSFVSMTPFDQKNLTFEQTQQKRCLDSIFLSILGVMKNQVPFTVGFSGVAGGINHQLRLGFQKNIWAAFRFPQKHLKLDLPLVSPCWP